MKNKIKSRLIMYMSIALCVIALAITAFCASINNKENKSSGYEELSASYDLTNTIAESDLIFEYDDTAKTATFTGIVGYPAVSYYEGKTLNIPSSVIRGGENYTVTAFDSSKLTTTTKVTAGNREFDATTLHDYGSVIYALIIPSSVESINKAAFYGMASLQYLETPFIGQTRGCKMPIHSMFSLGYQSVSDDTYQPQYLSKADNTLVSTDPTETTWYDTAVTNKFYYTLPSNLYKVKVTNETALGKRAFINVDSLEEVELPNTLVNLEEFIFSSCNNLKTVNIPESISALYRGMFSQCTSLESIVIPSNMKTIPDSFLAECTSLKEVYMSTQIEKIEAKAFYKDENLEHIYLYQDDISNLKENASQFNLPSGLLSIGDKAFGECSMLEKFEVPNSVTSIGEGALSGCFRLKDLTLPFIGQKRGLTSGMESLFGYIFGADSIDAGVYSANEGDYTFKVPTSLRTITITDETAVATEALAGLSTIEKGKPLGVETIVIVYNDNLQSIATGVFSSSAALKHISIPYIGGDHTKFASMFGTTAANGLSPAYQGGTTYQVPSSLEKVVISRQGTIYTGSFYNMNYIKYVEIGNYTSYIQNDIFYNNFSLEELVLPFVGFHRGEFYARWWYWRDIQIRNSLGWIFSGSYHSDTYANDTLRTWDSYRRWIPNTFKKLTITNDTVINYYSLRNYSTLTDITIKGASYISEGALGGCSSLERLSVPFIGSDANVNGYSGENRTLGWVFGKSAYGSADRISYGASQSGGYFQIPALLKYVTISGTTTSTIPNYAFANMKNVSSITLNSAVKQVNYGAFMNCKDLETITWGENTDFETIGDYSFYNCAKIIEMEQVFPTLEKGYKKVGNYALAGTSISNIDFTKLSSVGNYAFSGCLRLTGVNVTGNVTAFGKGVFANCSYLTSASLSRGQATEYLFQNCISLTGINISNVTDIIPAGMFAGCENLKSTADGLVMASTTVSIGKQAFKDCKSFTRFVIPANVESIADEALLGCNNLDYMIIPKKVTKIGKNVFTNNIGNGFVIYVYQDEENWPTGWSEGWNCVNPVFTMPPKDDTTYIFEFSDELSGYVISGIQPGIYLEGNVVLPKTHNSVAVKGVKKDAFKTQIDVTSLVIPDSYKLFEEGCFNNGGRVDLYFEAKSNTSGIPNTFNELQNLIAAGLVFYGEMWENKTTNNGSSTLPYVKLSSIDFTYDGKLSIVYNQEQHTPTFVSATTKAIEVKNDGVTNVSKVIYDKDNTTWRNLFEFEYKNNIQAGTAYAIVTLNKEEYEKYLQTSGALRFSGVGRAEFEIYKRELEIYRNDDNDSLCTEFTLTYHPNTYWYNDVWGNAQVRNLDFDRGFTFAGVLRTNGNNAGLYEIFSEPYNEDFYWSTSPRIYFKGQDVTRNFEIYVNLRVNITRLYVNLEWTGGEEASDGVYEYQYTGKAITPTARAVTDSGEVMNGCSVLVENLQADSAIYPSTREYRASARIAPESQNNYVILNPESDDRIYTDFRIVNAKLVINAYNKALMLSHNAKNVEINVALDNFVTFSGLAEGSIINGNLISIAHTSDSTAHDKTTYTAGKYTGSASDTIVWSPQVFEGIVYNGSSNPKLDFLIYRMDGENKLIENDYYDVTVDASITVVYDEFEIELMIGDEVLTGGEIRVFNNKQYLYYKCEVDGSVKTISAKVLNVDPSLEKGVYSGGYFLEYLYNNTTTTIPMEIKEIAFYPLGVAINPGDLNLERFSLDIMIEAVKSNIKFNSLDKEYDGQPISLDNFIAKKGENQDITLAIYDSTRKQEIDPPTAPGTYYVYVVAEETDYFNAYEGYVKFVISPRTINIYVDRINPEDANSAFDPSMYYSGLQRQLMIDDQRLHDLGVVLEGDTFSGCLMSRSSTPGVYSAEVSADWYWLSPWTVFSKDGYNHTSYYTIKLNGEFEILPNIMQIDSITGYSGYYDGAYHSVKISLTDPSVGYTIYYSLDEINKNNDSEKVSWLIYNPSFIAPGHYTVYFKIVAENYETYYGQCDIDILEKEIVYTRPAALLESDGKYYIDYDGFYHSLEILVGEPITATVFYSLDGAEFSTEIPFVRDSGTHTLAYQIVASNYTTVNGSYTFSVTDANLLDPTGLGIHANNINTPYDGAQYSIEVNIPSTITGAIIYYKTDTQTDWGINNPTYINAGNYKVLYRVCIPGYKMFESFALITITKLSFEGISVTDYEASYDGAYHGVTINGLSKYSGYTVLYTTNSDIANNPASSGWTESPIERKDVVSGLVVYIYISMPNYESIALQGHITITQGDVDIDFTSGYEVEYMAKAVKVSDLGIVTVHDGNVIPRYYLAVKDALGNYTYDPEDLIQAPTELGDYYVILSYRESQNCLAKTVEFGFSIVPRRLTVDYISEVEYNGLGQSPLPTVVTGTPDILLVLYSRDDGVAEDPKEIGDYVINFRFSETTANYVIVNPTVTFSITKIKLLVSFDIEYDYDYIEHKPWSNPDSWEDFKFTEKLLEGHKFSAKMQTNSYIRGTYIYTTLTDQEYLNKIIVSSYGITDSNGDDVTSKYYEVEFNAIVRIVYPKLNIELKDVEIPYDGYEHGINIDVPNNISGLSYSYADEYDYQNGDWHSDPVTFKNCGTYKIYVLIQSPMYEDFSGYATLTIKKTTLNITLEPFDATYDASEFNVDFNIDVYGVNKRLADVRYFPVESNSYESLLALYRNFDSESALYKSGLTSMVNAGDYFACVFIPSDVNWNDSFTIETVTIKQREVYFTINTDPYFKTYNYDGNKKEYGLGSTIIDTTSITEIGHKFNQSHLKYCSVQTISPNSSKAGYRVYMGSDGFEFKDMIILDAAGNNVYKNYRPVFDDAYLQITIKSIRLDQFDAFDLEREYDGTPANPTIVTPSDGDITYTYFKVGTTDTDLTAVSELDSQNVGRYFVTATIGAGTNYLPWDGGAVGAFVTITQKVVEIKWDNLVLEFNGYGQAPSATYIDIHNNEISAEVYIVLMGELMTNVLQANLYEAFATTSNTNYLLTNTSTMFEISPKTYDIDVTADQYISDKKWTYEFNEEDIDGFITGLKVTDVSGINKAMISTKESNPGLYEGNSRFNINVMVLNAEGIDVTDSILFNLIGRVVIHSNEIEFECEDYSILYDGETHTIWDSLKIYNPINKNSVSILQSTDNENWVTGVVEFINVGTYTIYFKISADGYDTKEGSMILEILQKESFLSTGAVKLDKEYDGTRVSETYIKENVTGYYNGNNNQNDLVVTFYDLGSNTPLSEAPINAGEYEFVITCINDSDPDYIKNYTALEARKPFTISSKALNLEVRLDKEITPNDLSNKYDSGNIVKVNIPGLGSYNELTYRVYTDVNMKRGTYTNDSAVIIYNKETDIFTFGDPFDMEFNFKWFIKTTDGTNLDVSFNYEIHLDFELVIHYPYMKVRVDDVNSKYTGNPVFGTYTPVVPSTPINLIQKYGNTAGEYIENSLISTISGTNPGTYRVYYYYECDGYEPCIGSYLINIEFIDRIVEVDNEAALNREYNGHVGVAPIYRTYKHNSTDPTDDYSAEAVTIKYQRVGYTEILNEAIEAGKYLCIITIPKSTYYNESIYKFEFEISRKSVNMKGTYTTGYTGYKATYDDFSNTQTNYTFWYNDGTQVTNLVITGVLETNNYAVKSYWSDDNSLRWQNGRYTICKDDVDITHNYQIVLTDECSLVIEAGRINANVINTLFEYEPDVVNYVTPQQIFPTGCSVTYSESRDGVYSDTKIGYTAVGVYTYYVKFSKPNYKDEIIEVTMTIVPKKIELEITNLDKVYDGIDILETAVFNVQTNCNEVTKQLIKDNSSFKSYDASLEGNASGPWVDMADSRPFDVGRYQLVVALPNTPSGNYEGGEYVFEFEISAKKVNVIWDKTTFVYDGTVQKPVATIAEASKMTPLYDVTPITAPDASSKNVGGYSIRVYFDNCDNYIINASQAEVLYTISKRPVTIQLNTTRKYDGNAFEFIYNAPDGYQALGIADGHTMSTSSLLSKYSAVGKYTNFACDTNLSQFIWNSANSINNMPVILDSNDSNSDVTSNYDIKYNLSLVINYNDINVTEVDYIGNYDGLPHSIDVNVNNIGDGFVITYSTTKTGTYTTTKPVFINAGTYNVYYKVSKEGYTTYECDTPGIVTINKTDAGLALENPYLILDKTYNGLPIINPAVTTSTIGNNYNVTYSYYSINDDGVVSSTKIEGSIVNAGKYRLIISLDDNSGNYENATIIIDFEISKRIVHLSLNSELGKVSMKFNSSRWVINANDLVIDNLVSGQEFGTNSIIQTVSANVGDYKEQEDFMWQSAYTIYQDSTDVTNNYIVDFNLYVTITAAEIECSVTPYTGYYDTKQHTIDIVVSKPITGAVIEYTEDPISGTYSTTPIYRTFVGTTIVYIKISAPNYNTKYLNSTININGLSDDIELAFTYDYEYTGFRYPTPKVITQSTGTQTVIYYDAADTAKANPMTDAPINAGSYYFVILVDTDGIYDEIEISDQSFKISPKKISVDWNDLSQEYTGDVDNPLLPTASYTDVNGNPITLTINTETDMINAGIYSVGVTSPDSNYAFINPTENFVITKKKIEEPLIQTDMKFKYGEIIVVKDIYGNIYELDDDGTIKSITYICDPDDPSDDVKDEDINLPYKIILSPDTCADGVNVPKHTLEIILDDPNNTEWTNKKNSQNLEIDYVILPYDFIIEGDKGDVLVPLEVSIVIEGKTFEYTGEEIRPSVVVTLRDPITKEKVATLYDEADPNIPVDEIAGYKVTYYDNVEITEPGNYAIIEIQGINNYYFLETREFTIVANAPEVITLVDNSIIKFIEIQDQVFENGSAVTTVVDRTEVNKPTDGVIYLGHLHQNTALEKILDQISNVRELIKVYDSEGTLITEDKFSYTYIGTGYKICLYDKYGVEIDSVEAILYGDLNGDGQINMIDLNIHKTINSGQETYSSLGVFYYASLTSRTESAPNMITFNLIKAILNSSLESADFNIDYIID